MANKRKKKNVKNVNNVNMNTTKKDRKKNRKHKRKKMDPKKKKIIISVILLTFLIAIGVVFGMLYGIIQEAKLDVEDLAIEFENSVVLDIDGETIAVLSGDENREFIELSEMAEYLPVAFVSIEDERFYEHMGVDIKRTAAATLTYIFNGGESSFGGSTITQQVIKNLTNEDERTWKRKIKEMIRAYYLEKELSKDQILELYLNLIFMGGNCYGVEVASNYYFSKSASELDLAECAFLAGINNSPNSYDPFADDNTENLEKIKTRTLTVLNKMYELGKINSEEEYEEAVAEVEAGLNFEQGTIVETIYSYHTDAAITQIINQIMEEKDMTYEAAKLYLYGGGYTIYTTQDSEIQAIMDEESQKSKYINTVDGQQSQAGMVLLDHETGYVLGVIGGLGEKTAMGFNRGTQLVKQTGSAMKPLAVVAPGIDSGAITAGTVYDDVPYQDFKNYNYFKGLITIRHAIESSQNIPMLKAIQTVGVSNSLEFLHNLGFSNLDDENDNNISLALGGLTNGASPLEMAAAYGAIANDGVYIEPTFYIKVVDSDGNTVLEPNQETRTVMSAAAAYVVKEILTEPVTGSDGTAKACAISGMSVAAKTGTTNNDYDRWLCGFTPYYTAATWYGYDENRTVSGWSLSPATQIWASVMQQVHSGLEGKTFSETMPDNVVTATICRDSGLLATDTCEQDQRGDRSYTEYYVKGTAPTKECTTHVKVEICEDSGDLANEYCTNVKEVVYITREDADTDTAWQSAADAKYMLTITDTCSVHTEEADTTKPVIKLNGSSSITINLGESFSDPGATATDNKDGDLTDKIETSGTVNVNKAGTYKITYTVEDSAGNTASVTRTVIVVDNSEPDDNEDDNNTTGGNQTGDGNNTSDVEDNEVDNTT